MKTRPLLFSTPMVQALLAGRKTQTRRPLKTQPIDVLPMKGDKAGVEWVGLMQREPEPKGVVFGCKYGKTGDLLWVRETSLPDFPKSFSYYDWSWAEVPEEYRTPEHVLYRASSPDLDLKWHPSIHMPRWASRLTLRITDVRVQRLQEVGQGDACAEGCPSGVEPVEWYEGLWESINGPDSWGANPWVWAISFEVIHNNVDEVMKETA